MKLFENGRAQFVTYNDEMDETYTVSLSNLVENADAEALRNIGNALGTIIDGEFEYANVVVTQRVNA